MAEGTGQSELRTGGSVGPLVSTEATGRLGSPSCRVRDTDGPRAPETGICAGCLTSSAWTSGLPQRPPFR